MVLLSGKAIFALYRFRHLNEPGCNESIWLQIQQECTGHYSYPLLDFLYSRLRLRMKMDLFVLYFITYLD